MDATPSSAVLGFARALVAALPDGRHRALANARVAVEADEAAARIRALRADGHRAASRPTCHVPVPRRLSDVRERIHA